MSTTCKGTGTITRPIVEPRQWSAPAADPTKSAPDGSPCYPLSFSQQRLWFLDRLDPGNAAYNVYRAVRIVGPLDREALQESLTEIVRRHGVLRTIYPMVGMQPMQIIGSAATVNLTLIDLSGVSGEERQRRALAMANVEAARPFDLAGGPLLRTKLLRLEPEEHILLLATHHIAADGWSVGILFSELAALYDAFVAGKPSPLPELPLQYADYAAEQRSRLQESALAGQIAYWKQRLHDAPPSLSLPLDFPRPAVQRLQNFRGARHYLLMPKALLLGLVALTRRENVTLYMLLLAATKILLSRWTGQRDLVVGSPIAGRNRPEIERLIGCFSNTLVLRTSLSPDLTFRQFLGQIREVILGALDNQEVPFEKLVEELRPKRVANRMTLFQVNFRLLTAPPPPLKLAGLDIHFLDVDNHMAKFDLAFELNARLEGLGGYVEYFTDLFKPSTIEWLCKELQEVLVKVVAQPNALLGTLLNSVPLEPSSASVAIATSSDRRSKLRSILRKQLSVGSGPQSERATPSVKPPACPADSAMFTLRPASLKDSRFLYELRKIVLREYVSQFSGWSKEQQEAYYLDFDPSIHEIIVVDNRDVGDVSILRNRHEYRFVNLHLLPEFQSRGIGSAILKRCIAEAEEAGVPVVLQGVLKSNPAIKLYQRLGFEISAESELRYEMTRPCGGVNIPASSPASTTGGKPRLASIRGTTRRSIEISNSDQTPKRPRTT